MGRLRGNTQASVNQSGPKGKEEKGTGKKAEESALQYIWKAVARGQRSVLLQPDTVDRSYLAGGRCPSGLIRSVCPRSTHGSLSGRRPNAFYVSVLCPHNIGWHSPQSEKTKRRDPQPFTKRRDPYQGFPGGSEGKASACIAGDLGSIPGLGRSPGEGNGNSLQCSCLENPMDRGAWWATVHSVAKSQTRLEQVSTHVRQLLNGQ